MVAFRNFLCQRDIICGMSPLDWVKTSVAQHKHVMHMRSFTVAILYSYRYSSCCCWGDPLQKHPRVRRFKSELDEIWHDFFLKINTPQKRNGILYDFVISFHTEKCSHLVSAHAAFAILRSTVRRLPASNFDYSF